MICGFGSFAPSNDRERGGKFFKRVLGKTFTSRFSLKIGSLKLIFLKLFLCPLNSENGGIYREINP